MKTYKKVQIIAKNAPSGSYAAGCPTGTRVSSGCVKTADGKIHSGCQYCEVAK